MIDYTEVYDAALAAIEETGRTVTLLKRNISAYDPITNTMTDGADTSRTVKATFTNYNERDIDGEIIQRGDKRCLIAGAVSMDEVVVDGADEYKIVNVAAIQPGDVVLLSKVQVRRWPFVA